MGLHIKEQNSINAYSKSEFLYVKPKSKGGEDIATNVVPACRRCNQEKGSSNWLGWMRATFGTIPDREQMILTHIS